MQNQIPNASRPEMDGSTSRRGLIVTLGSVMFGTILGLLAHAEGASGKKNKRKRRKKRKRSGGDGSPGAGSEPSANGGNAGGGNPNPSGGNPAPGNPGSGSLDGEESQFLTLINTYRAQRGLGAFAHNLQLGQAATAHSQDLADHNRTGHTGSDGSGPQQRIERAGYDWSAWGENVFWGDASAQGAFDWWKNSPDHNRNMLSASFTEIGIGRAYNAASTFDWYWTTDFGRPG